MSLLGKGCNMARRNLLPVALLLAAAASWAVAGAASDGPATEYVLHVKAVIDGSSDFIVVSDKAFWRQGTLPNPGQQLRTQGDGPWPTVINGKEWFPNWAGISSTVFNLPFKLPPDLSGVTATVEKIQARGDVQANVRKRQVEVRLDDSKIDGADWYEFELHIKVPGAPVAASTSASGAATPPASQPAATAAAPQAATAASASAPQKDAASTAPQSGALAPAAPKPPAATTSKDFIAAQADAEAKGLAAQRLAAEGAQVNAAAQALAQAQATRDAVWQQARALEVQLQQGEPAYQKAVREEADIRKMGWESGGTLYFQPGPYAQFIAAGNLRQQLEGERNRLTDALTQRRGELAKADVLLQVAQNNYGDLRGRYEKAFEDIYNVEYPKKVRELEALRDKKVAEFDARRKALLKDDLIPGQYTWIESGQEVDKFAFAPDHSVKSLTAKDKPAGQWQVSEEGLKVAQGGAEWMFQPGAPNAFIGTYLGPDQKAKGRKAMLQKAVPGAGAAPASGGAQVPVAEAMLGASREAAPGK